MQASAFVTLILGTVGWQLINLARSSSRSETSLFRVWPDEGYTAPFHSARHHHLACHGFGQRHNFVAGYRINGTTAE